SSMGVSLAESERKGLLAGFRSLSIWPDVIETLEELRKRRIQVSFLSDFSAAMLDSNVTASGLSGYFGPHLTTDRVQAFKPSPAAHGMGPDVLALRRDEIAFLAFGAWDAAGAKWFGYPTLWVNRLGAPAEKLDAHPDAMLRDLQEVPHVLDKM